MASASRCDVGTRRFRGVCRPPEFIQANKGQAVLKTPWSNENRVATRRKAKVAHGKKFETDDTLMTWMPIRNNETKLHPGTKRLGTGDIVKRKTRLMNKRHSKQRCEAYHQARRAFDNKAGNPDWKRIWENKYMCKWAEFYQRQKIIHYKSENVRLNAGVEPNEWKTNAWIPKLRAVGVPIDYDIGRDEPQFARSDCPRQRETKQYTPVDLTANQREMDAAPVEEKCRGDYNPFGGFVDEENTIPYLEGTDYGFAKSNASLVVILREVRRVINAYIPQMFPEQEAKYHFSTLIDRETLINIICEPYRRKLISRDYDGTENGDHAYTFSMADEVAILVIAASVLMHYWFAAFCRQLDVEMTNAVVPANATAAQKRSLKEKLKEQLNFKKNFIKADIIHDFFKDDSVSQILTQAQYSVWGQYSLVDELPAATYNAYKDAHLSPALNLYLQAEPDEEGLVELDGAFLEDVED